MKQLLQIITLFLVGWNALQFAAAFGLVILFLKILFDKISESSSCLKIKMEDKEIEMNVWSIE